MEYIFSLKNGIKVVIYTEGNNIIVNYLSSGRMVRAGILFNNYRLGLTSIIKDDEIYMAYVSVENELVWDKLGSDNPIVLYADKGEQWMIDKIFIKEYQGALLLFYMVVNHMEKQSEIKYILPYGERKSRIILSNKDVLIDYDVGNMFSKYYLWYREKKDSVPNFFIMNLEDINDIKIKEIFIEETPKEKIKEYYEINTEKKLREEQEKYRMEIKKNTEMLESNYSKKLDERLHNVEKHYKKQYEELSEMTREIQEEGKKWRELYYKSVKKK